MRRSTRSRGGVGSRGENHSASPSGARPSAALIEEATDRLAAAPYDVLGEDDCAELRALVRPWSTVFAEHLR